MRYIIVLMCLFFCFTACDRRNRGGRNEVDYEKSLSSGEKALFLLSRNQIPNFSFKNLNKLEMQKSISCSLKYLSSKLAKSKYPINGISRIKVVEALEIFSDILKKARNDSELKSMISRRLDVYSSVGCDNRGTVLFTGYYTPIFDARKQKTHEYRFPLYKKPADLIKGSNGSLSLQIMQNGATRPYPARADVKFSLKGLELVYLKDEFDAYLIEIQGSGKLRMKNGSLLDVGYDGTNGHSYHPISSNLIKDGCIPRAGLPQMRNYFKANPQKVSYYTNKNPRFIFFRITEGGPYGSIGQPVSRDISIATDKTIFPSGALCFVATKMNYKEYSSFRLDQDTGGAIRAPGRCDLYMGTGLAAEQKAGRQLAEGQLYYLIAK